MELTITLIVLLLPVSVKAVLDWATERKQRSNGGDTHALLHEIKEQGALTNQHLETQGKLLLVMSGRSCPYTQGVIVTQKSDDGL